MMLENLRSCKRETLWKKVIRRKYGEEEVGWHSYEMRDSNEVWLWKTIRK